jgi:hypothetical protein
MKPIECELERTIRMPIDQVLSRLVDIEGHNAGWPTQEAC